jgi:hypothetical protein
LAKRKHKYIKHKRNEFKYTKVTPVKDD